MICSEVLQLCNQVTLLSHSRMDFAAPRTLCLSSVAQTLSQISRLKPDRVAGDQDVGWQSKVRVMYSLPHHLDSP